MKQYTSKAQTAKLIKLGFPKPKFSFPIEDNEHPDYVDEDGNSYSLVESYSIGELIGLLCNPVIECLAEVWRIEYDGSKGQQFIEEDLIDALYKACIYSKENPQYD